MTDLSALIERVEALTGPSREVDAEIHALAVGGRVNRFSDGEVVIERPVDGLWIRNVLPLRSRKIAANTASLDAAVALVERVLPDRGHGYLPRFYKEHRWAGIISATEGRIDLLTATIAGGPTPAIALVLATLRALQAQGGGE